MAGANSRATDQTDSANRAGDSCAECGCDSLPGAVDCAGNPILQLRPQPLQEFSSHDYGYREALYCRAEHELRIKPREPVMCPTLMCVDAPCIDAANPILDYSIGRRRTRAISSSVLTAAPQRKNLYMTQSRHERER